MKNASAYRIADDCIYIHSIGRTSQGFGPLSALNTECVENVGREDSISKAYFQQVFQGD